MPSIEKAGHKIILREYSVLNIYEFFGGGDFSPGKIEFGVVVVRVFLVVRVSIPGVNSGAVKCLELELLPFYLAIFLRVSGIILLTK